MPQSRLQLSGNSAERHSCGRRFAPGSAHFDAAAGGGAKIRHTRTRTKACAAGLDCVTIGPPGGVNSTVRPHCL